MARGKRKWKDMILARDGMSWTRARLMGIALLMAIGIAGMGAAEGAVITGPGFSADVSAIITLTHLPRHSSAPVTLTVEGTITPAADGSSHQLKAVEVRLARQLQITTTGLATCTLSDLLGHALAQARQRCGKALIGTGSLDVENTYPDAPPESYSQRFLLFNATASKLLVYAYLREATATIVARGTASKGTLQMSLPELGGTTGFRFHIGRTWRDGGQKRSYLSGRCAGGALSNRVTLTFRGGPRLSGAVPAHCKAK